MALKPEQIFQINHINWFKHNFPHFKNDIHHFANERQTTWQEGRNLKRMGVLRGVLDIHIGIASKGFHGFWQELKVPPNKPTQEQLDFINRKREQGYHAVVAYSEDEAKAQVIDYLK